MTTLTGSARGAPSSWAPPVVVGLLAAGLLSYVHRLGASSFWLDEAISDGFTRLHWPVLWREILADGGNQGLYYALLAVWRTFGDGEVWLRLPSVGFAAATLVVFHRLAHRMFGAHVAVVALALLAVNPFLVRYAQEVRSYSLAMLLATASTAAFVSAMETGRRRSWAAYGVLAVLSVLTHLFGFFFLAGHALSLLVFRPRDLPWRAILLTAVGSGTVLVPVALHALRTGTAGVAYLGPTTVADVRTVVTSLAGNRGPVVAAVIVGAWALALVAGAQVLRGGPRSRETWRWAVVLGWGVVPVGLVLGMSLLGAPIFRDKYLIGALPGLCLLAALGLTRLRPQPLVVGVLAAVLAVSAVRIVAEAKEHHQDEDWRAITAHVLDRAGPADRFVFYAPWMSEAFKYYVRQADEAQLARLVLMPNQGWLPFAEAPVRVYPFEQQDLRSLCEAHGDPVWLVVHDVSANVTLGDVEAALARTHVQSAAWSFAPIEVRRYEPAGTGPGRCPA